MHVKKDDKVTVISGSDKGKTGKVLKVFPAKNRVLVEGVNIKKKHERRRRQDQKGQVVELPVPINASNVKLAK